MSMQFIAKMVSEGMATWINLSASDFLKAYGEFCASYVIDK